MAFRRPLRYHYFLSRRLQMRSAPRFTPSGNETPPRDLGGVFVWYTDSRAGAQGMVKEVARVYRTGIDEAEVMRGLSLLGHRNREGGRLRSPCNSGCVSAPWKKRRKVYTIQCPRSSPRGGVFLISSAADAATLSCSVTILYPIRARMDCRILDIRLSPIL